MIILAILIIYASSVTLLLDKKGACNMNIKKAIHVFGYLYLAGYTFTLAALILPYPLKLYAVSMLLLLMNFIPFIWFNHYFLKVYTMEVSSPQDHAGLERIYSEYNITKREREIAELVLQGKSNKEIEDVVFISVHTVKNHIHNLYRKLSVKSRGQLVHLIIKNKELKP